jgi:hypothetical protein
MRNLSFKLIDQLFIVCIFGMGSYLKAGELNLETIFVESRNISYGNYQVVGKPTEPSDDSDEYKITLSQGNRVIKEFPGLICHSVDRCGKDKYLWNNFGLFSLIKGQSKQLIIEQFTGGMNCCNEYFVYDLGNKPVLMFKANTGKFGLKFSDLNNDGTYEIVMSIYPLGGLDYPNFRTDVVFKYEEAEGHYRPANKEFLNYFLPKIKKKRAAYLNRKQDAAFFSKQTEMTGTDFEEVVSITIDYLYADEDSKAWEFFNTEYTRSDKIEIKKKILEKKKYFDEHLAQSVLN